MEYGYRVADGFRVVGDPAAIGEAFEDIERVHGVVDEEAVVEFARANPGHAVHANIIGSLTTEEAAERYFRTRATYLIRAIQLVVDERVTRAVIPLVEPPNGGTANGYRMTPHDVASIEAIEAAAFLRRLRLLLVAAEPWEHTSTFSQFKDWFRATRDLL